MNKLEKAISKEKKIEFWIGVLFLVPAILGTLSFMWCLCPASSDFGYSFARMGSLKGIWDYLYHDSGCAASPAPLFMGLMAIAGAYLIKDSLRYFFIDEGKTVLPKSEKTQTTQNTAQVSGNKEKSIDDALGLN